MLKPEYKTLPKAPGSLPPDVYATHSRSSQDFGDLEGHPFHGNQWTGGRGGGADPEANRLKLQDRFLDHAYGDAPRPNTTNLGEDRRVYTELVSLSDEQRGRIKKEIVEGRTADILEEMKGNPELAAQVKEFGAKEITNATGQQTTQLDEAIANWAGHLPPEEWDKIAQAVDDPNPSVLSDAVRELPSYPGDEAAIVQDRVQAYVDQWSTSAADTEPQSLVMQQIVDETFADTTSKAFEQYMRDSELDRLGVTRHMDDLRDSQGEIMAAYVRAEYGATQDYLAAQGIGPNDDVKLFRGMEFYGPADLPPAFPTGYEPVTPEVDLNPASSWTINYATAEDFAVQSGNEFNYMLTDTVKGQDIISTAWTGRGAAIEGELIVKNTPNNDVRITRLPKPEDDPDYWG